jgi:hypothetical protein
MSVEETGASPEIGTALSGAEPYSQAWWRERSSDELRLIMNRGLELGPAFDGAMVEAERRAREFLQAEEMAAFEREAREKRFRRLILVGLLLACLVALIASQTMR